MSSTKKLIGGARIDGFNATWPFASLRADANQLILNVMLSGEYVFPESQVSMVTRYSSIPFIGWGVQVHHTIPHYPNKIIFWYLGFPDKVLAFISDAGFNRSKFDAE